MSDNIIDATCTDKDDIVKIRVNNQWIPINIIIKDIDVNDTDYHIIKEGVKLKVYTNEINEEKRFLKTENIDILHNLEKCEKC